MTAQPPDSETPDDAAWDNAGQSDSDWQPRIVGPEDHEQRMNRVLMALPWGLRLGGRLVLWTETLWPLLFFPLTLLLGWLGLAWFGLFDERPGLGPLSLLAMLAAALWLIRRQWRRDGAGLPNNPRLLHLIEQRNQLTHRPLTSLTDSVADTRDPVTRALWSRHLARLRRELSPQLAIGWPQTHTARRDPYALRFLGLLLAVLGLAIAGPDAGRRLSDALLPGALPALLANPPTALDAWVAPPEYTGLPPIYLAGTGTTKTTGTPDAGTPEAPKVIVTPIGSVLYARVTRDGQPTDRPPEALLAGHATDFEADGPGQFILKLPLDETLLATLDKTAQDRDQPDNAPPSPKDRLRSDLRLTLNGRTLAEWPILIEADLPPSVVLSDTPSVAEDQSVDIPYAALDDYGLSELSLVMTLKPPVEGRKSAPEMEQVIGRDLGNRATATAHENLLSHPWAGLAVDIALTAGDALGQQATSGHETMTLPMRDFKHPVARKLVEERQHLTLFPQSGRQQAIDTVRTLLADPDAFGDDPAIAIALSQLATRLKLHGDDDTIASAQQLMWQLAVQLEDGRVGMAQRKLAEAGKALEKALSSDTPPDRKELDRLIDEYQQALQALVATIQQELMEKLARGEQLPSIPEGDYGELLDGDQLQQMIDKLRQLSETGSREAAQQMLSEMQEMLSSLMNGEMQQPSEESQKYSELAKRLGDLTKDQQRLLDDTFKGRPADPMMDLLQTMPDGSLPPGFMDEITRLLPKMRDPSDQQRRQEQNMSRALKQEGLRRDLGDIMLDLSELTDDLPQNLGNAERAMNDATSALRQDRTARALQQMGEALEELQSLQKQMQQRAQQNMAGHGRPRFTLIPGMARGQRPGTDQGLDPLGRATEDGGRGNGSDVKIPTDSELQRARDILNELRKRAGQFNRPEEELDYIERLLKQF